MKFKSDVDVEAALAVSGAGTFGGDASVTGTLYGSSTNFSGSGDYAGGMTLGTGASTAEAKLEIGHGRTGNGYSYVDLIGDATYTDYGFRIIRGNSGANTTSQIIHRGTGNFDISTSEAANLRFKTGGSERMRIAPDGNVGIGTTSPETITSTVSTLTLNGTSGTISGGFAYQVNGTTKAYSYVENNYLRHQAQSGVGQYWFADGSIKMAMLSSGNVGIGTTNPSYPLEVKSASPFVTTNSTGTGNSGFAMLVNAGSNGVGVIATDNGGSLTFDNGATGAAQSEKMRIAADGAIKFNTYGAGTLVSDASGNITVSSGGGAGGPYLPLTGGTLSGPGNLTVGGTLNVTGITTLNGQANVGSVVPRIDSTFSLGSNTLRFASIYGDGLTITNNATFGGEVIVASGEYLSWGTSGATAIEGSTVSDKMRFYTDSTLAFTLDASQNATFAGDILVNTTGGYFEVDKAENSVKFADNTEALFGTGQDLKIYHDGSNSYITDTGTGNLLITSNGASVQINKGLTENMAEFIVDGAVNLYYDSAKKFETTSAGITVTGAATATTFIGDLNGTINTVTTAVTKANATNDTTVATTAFVQNLIGTIPAGLVFQGTWNAATNTPTLTSGSGTTGHFYIVSTSGSTNLDGVTDWVTGDWAVFIEQGGTDAWEKIDNSSVLDGAGTGQTLPLWSGSGTSNTLTDSNITQDANLITKFGKTAVTTTAVASINHASNDFLYINGGTSGASIGDDDQNTRAIFYNNDYIRFDAAGAERMRIEANGNVGIGITNPSQKLNVDGGATGVNQGIPQTSGTTQNGILRLTSGGATYGETLDFGMNVGPTYAWIQATNKGGLGTNYSLSLNPNGGNVGIGTTGPLNRLFVTAATAGDYAGFIENTNATNGYGLVARTAHTGTSAYAFAARAGTSDIFVVRGDGNVGIGTTSPAAKLQVSGSVQLDVMPTNESEGSIKIGRYDANTSRYNLVKNFVSATAASNYMRFAVHNGTENATVDVMSLNGAGNVGIGTTDPVLYTNSWGRVLGIKAASGYAVTQIAGSNGNGGEIDLGDASIRHAAIASTSGSNLGFYTNSTNSGHGLTERMRIIANGNVGIGNTSPDFKLHTNLNLSGTPLSYLNGTANTFNGSANIGVTHNSTAVGTNTTAGVYLANNANNDGAPSPIIAFSALSASGSYNHTYAAIYGIKTAGGADTNWVKGDLTFATGNTTGPERRMTILANGNVGIGTTTPTNGKLVIDSTANQIAIETGTAGDGRLNIGHFANGTFIGTYGDDGGAADLIRFGTHSGDERMRILSNGNVGIGETAPKAPLNITGVSLNPVVPTAASSSGILRIESGNGGVSLDIGSQGSAPYSMWMQVGNTSNNTGDVYPILLNPLGGNVGIGATNPQSKLQVDGGIQMAGDTDTASATKVGTMRYRTGTEYVEVDGVELVTNGDFATDTDWTKETGWSIGSGVASYNGTSANNALYENLSLTTGTIYRLSFTIVNYVSGTLIGALSSGSATGNTPNITANGDYVFNLTATGVLCIFRSTSSFNGSIDNVSLVEVTAEDASYADMCMQTGSSTYEWVNIVRNTY